MDQQGVGRGRRLLHDQQQRAKAEPRTVVPQYGAVTGWRRPHCVYVLEAEDQVCTIDIKRHYCLDHR